MATLAPGQSITHPEFGAGVVMEVLTDGTVKGFFPDGQRVVPTNSLLSESPWERKVLEGVEGTLARQKQLWLTLEAHEIPRMEGAPTLTTAKVDLLPHQIVLTHRVATQSPRRLLVADEVGLGKTIEVALILRELESRGEMKRALMVVPAGLVNNWHHELNEVFGLKFEVFGSEGDVFDRKSNAFAKHDRLIASIDTLKQEKRVASLLEAPSWDMIVFDEAHHLSIYKTGKKLTSTANYDLAAKLKDKARDLLFLSATPHQGDHFRFWKLIDLLRPGLFHDEHQMLSHRYRLTDVVARRTKADACKADGSPLFARRKVMTEELHMTDDEKAFYEKLREYLREGFDLAAEKKKESRAIGLLMTVFQKIAASSFSAVRRTLRRRLISLTVHEAILHEESADGYTANERAQEAKALIFEAYNLPQDKTGRAEADRVYVDIKAKIAKKISEAQVTSSLEAATGGQAAEGEDLAATLVKVALPNERKRIRELLGAFPSATEAKTSRLLQAFEVLWKQNPTEKIVVFATYLGTVEMLQQAIETNFPDKGVVVLRGGDHGSKLTAEKRFRDPNGPRVMICTAAGREGINLQFSRILFNFDLPWNPMDLEQRIGRIHRYGQLSTAQVYNLVVSDTIEGQVYLLLRRKLLDIAKTLGKVDEDGSIAEDFESQILGQLSEKIPYDKLYQDALSDPELKRTNGELEAALDNAKQAREVVFELFQDLERFSLTDYQPLSDTSTAMARLVAFFQEAVALDGQKLLKRPDGLYELSSKSGRVSRLLTTDRERAKEDAELDLIGLDHEVIQATLRRIQDTDAQNLGFAAQGNVEVLTVLTYWLVEYQGKKGKKALILPIAVKLDGTRAPEFEGDAKALLSLVPAAPQLKLKEREKLRKDHVDRSLRSEMTHRGLGAEGGYSTRLLGWVEVAPAPLAL